MTASAPTTKIFTIDFASPEIWNSFYIPYLHDKTEHLHLYGSAGSGKSRFEAQKEVVFSFFSHRANRKTLVVRKVATTLKDSVYAELKSIIHSLGLTEYFDVLKSPLTITNKVTGVQFLFIGLDDVEKVKSISGVDRIWIEEATELTSRNELDQLRLRLRGFEEVQITLTYNPINRFHWLNTEIHEKLPEGHKIVKSTYLNNEKLLSKDPNYAKSIERYRETNPNYYRVYGQGLWGENSEGLIYPDYETVSEMPEPQFYGLDFGFTHPSALIAGCTADNFNSEKPDLFVKELIYRTSLSSADLIAEMNRLSVSKVKPIIADSARPEMIADIRKAGYNIQPCKKYAGSILDGINEVKKHNLKIVAGSKNVFIEVQNYCWREKNGRYMDDEPVDAVNHACDAFRYGLEARKVQSWTVSRRQSR